MHATVTPPSTSRSTRTAVIFFKEAYNIFHHFLFPFLGVIFDMCYAYLFHRRAGGYRKIYVPPPDRESRRQILSNSLKTIPCEKGVDLDELVDKSDGFSGAEVVALTTEAVMYAVGDHASQVERRHLIRSIEEITPQISQGMLDYYMGIKARFLT